jgi:phospholipid/cholesterol/gamma-HCH transport system substrate-binding protein
MSKNARYRSAEIKAGFWILISLIIFGGFLAAVSGAKFWEEMDNYRVRLAYIGGLEVGSPVRMGGMMVGKISNVEFLDNGSGEIELTFEVPKGLNIKSNTTAYLSFVTITSEHHLELDPPPAPAPPLKPGDLIRSKDLATLDGVMEQANVVSDTLLVVMNRVSTLLNPATIARIDSIVIGVNGLVQNASGELTGLLVDARQSVNSLDSLLSNVNNMLAGSDSLVSKVMADTRRTVQQATITLAGIDTTVSGVQLLLNHNAASLNGIIQDMEQTSVNLKVMTDQIKDNPFTLIRAFPRPERQLDQR